MNRSNTEIGAIVVGGAVVLGIGAYVYKRRAADSTPASNTPTVQNVKGWAHQVYTDLDNSEKPGFTMIAPPFYANQSGVSARPKSTSDLQNQGLNLVPPGRVATVGAST